MADKIYDYFMLCENIKKIDENITFAGIINDRGRLVAGGLREGATSLRSPQDDERTFTTLALNVKMREEFDKQLGHVNFAMSVRQKVTSFSMILGTDILYVTASPEMEYSLIPQHENDLFLKQSHPYHEIQ